MCNSQKMSIFTVQKEDKTKTSKPCAKIQKLFQTCELFSQKMMRADYAIYSLMEVMEHIQIQSKQIGMAKKVNCKFTPLQVLNLLVVFPFFSTKNHVNQPQD